MADAVRKVLDEVTRKELGEERSEKDHGALGDAAVALRINVCVTCPGTSNTLGMTHYA